MEARNLKQNERKTDEHTDVSLGTALWLLVLCAGQSF